MKKKPASTVDPPFVIFTMPNTLDAWLAKWLKCGHNGMFTAPSLSAWIEEVKLRGSVESFLPVSWKVLKQTIPDIKIIVVNRSISHIAEDFRKLNKPVEIEMLWQHFFVLSAIANSGGVGLIDLENVTDISDLLHWLWNVIHPHTLIDEDWLDECCEATTELGNSFPDARNTNIIQESLRESARLGGNSSTLWLN